MKNFITKFLAEYRELKYLAYHDVATGLYNRAYLTKKVNWKDYMILFFIDINNLSAINKRGHSFGDAHILTCVSDIKDKLDADDIFIRYAGDEFIVLSQKLSSKKLQTCKLYSVGRSFPSAESSLMESINVADKKMLYNKSQHKKST